MASGFETSRSHFSDIKNTLVMKIRIKENNVKGLLQELREINGQFELTKLQINRGNVLNIQFGNKDLSIKL